VLSVLCTGVGGESNGKSIAENMRADHKALYNDWKYLKDSVLYDVEEFWTIAKWRRGRIVGDCEDAALYMMNKALSHYSNSSIDDRVFIIGVSTRVNGTRANHAIFAIILPNDTWLVSDNKFSRGVRAMKELKDEYNVINSVTLHALRR
jgi:predicted transglutaminase-like cysteine proteinase